MCLTSKLITAASGLQRKRAMVAQLRRACRPLRSKWTIFRSPTHAPAVPALAPLDRAFTRSSRRRYWLGGSRRPELYRTNNAQGRSTRLANGASDGAATVPRILTAQIQEITRQIVTVLVLHEGTRDPRHQPFERRRRAL
jgi:hypothetical protein